MTFSIEFSDTLPLDLKDYQGNVTWDLPVDSQSHAWYEINRKGFVSKDRRQAHTSGASAHAKDHHLHGHKKDSEQEIQRELGDIVAVMCSSPSVSACVFRQTTHCAQNEQTMTCDVIQTIYTICTENSKNMQKPNKFTLICRQLGLDFDCLSNSELMYY